MSKRMNRTGKNMRAMVMALIISMMSVGVLPMATAEKVMAAVATDAANDADVENSTLTNDAAESVVVQNEQFSLRSKKASGSTKTTAKKATPKKISKVVLTGTKLIEKKTLTKDMLHKSVKKVVVLMSDGTSKHIKVNFTSTQIGKKITQKASGSHKGQMAVTLTYKNLSKKVWIKVKKATTNNKEDDNKQPTTDDNKQPTDDNKQPTTQTHKVTVIKNGTGNANVTVNEMTINGSATVKEGEYVFKLKAENDSEIASWTIDGVTQTGTEVKHTITKDVTLVINCNKKTHKVTVEYIGKQGTVKANDKIVNGTLEVEEGKCTITATPNYGDKVGTWYIDGKWYSETSVTIDLTKDIKVRVLFQEDPKNSSNQGNQNQGNSNNQQQTTNYKVYLSKTGEGSVFVDNTEIRTMNQFTNGSHFVTVQPKDGWKVSKLVVDGQVKTGTSALISLTKDTLIEVTFEKEEENKPVEPETTNFKVYASKNGEGFVYIDNTEINGVEEFTKGSHFAIVKPTEGWKLQSWTINGQVQTGTSAKINLSEDILIEVVFEKVEEPTPTPAKHEISVNKTGEGQVMVDNVELAEADKFDEGNHEIEVKAAEGYKVSSLKIGGVVQEETTADINLIEDTVIEVVFEKIEDPTPETSQVTITRVGEGQLFIAGNKVSFDENGTKTLELEVGQYVLGSTPAEGYKFSGYNFNGRELSNATATIAVERDCNLTVTFIKEDEFVTVEFKKPDSSSIEKNVVKVGEASAIPAAPSINDEEFIGWTLQGTLYSTDNETGLLEAIRALTSQKKDVEIFATYKKIERYYTVNVIDATLTDENDNLITDGRVLTGTPIKVKALEEKDGKPFHHFEDETGKKLADRSEYVTTVKSNMTIIAIYSDDAIVKTPVLTFSSAKIVSEGGIQLVKCYGAQIDVPNNYKVLSWGMEATVTISGTSKTVQIAVTDSTANSNWGKTEEIYTNLPPVLFQRGGNVTVRLYANIQEGSVTETVYSTQTETITVEASAQ